MPLFRDLAEKNKPFGVFSEDRQLSTFEHPNNPLASMKKAAFLLLCVTLSATGTFAAFQGIRFSEGTFAAAQAEAQKSGKLIFLDFFTTWCGPCQYMQREVFTDGDVGSLFNARFINLTIDAEKREPALVSKLAIQAYPTLVIMDAQGTVRARYEGALDSEQLIKFAEAAYAQLDPLILTNFSNVADFKYHIEEVAGFKLSSDSVAALVENFLNQLPGPQLRTEEAWELFVQYYMDFKGSAFEYVTQQADYFNTQFENFEEAYLWFVSTMVEKAVADGDEELLTYAATHYRTVRQKLNTKSAPDEYYDRVFKLAYYEAREEQSLFVPLLAEMINTYHPNDWHLLLGAAATLLSSDLEDGGIQNLPTASRWIQQAYKLKKRHPLSHYMMAVAEQKSGNRKKATAYMTRAIRLSLADGISLHPQTAELGFKQEDEIVFLTELIHTLKK